MSSIIKLGDEQELICPECKKLSAILIQEYEINNNHKCCLCGKIFIPKIEFIRLFPD